MAEGWHAEVSVLKTLPTERRVSGRPFSLGPYTAVAFKIKVDKT